MKFIGLNDKKAEVWHTHLFIMRIWIFMLLSGGFIIYGAIASWLKKPELDLVVLWIFLFLVALILIALPYLVLLPLLFIKRPPEKKEISLFQFEDGKLIANKKLVKKENIVIYEYQKFLLLIIEKNEMKTYYYVAHDDFDEGSKEKLVNDLKVFKYNLKKGY